MLNLIARASTTDFWGAAVPGWIEAVGGLGSLLVGAVALFLSISARKGVKGIANGLNTDNGTTVSEVHGGLKATGVAHAFVLWGVERDGRHYRLVNRSNTHPARVTTATDISDRSEKAFRLLVQLPITVEPGGSLPFSIEKSLVGAAVTAILLRWTEEDLGERFVTLYV